jgi:hypothetical protein
MNRSEIIKELSPEAFDKYKKLESLCEKHKLNVLFYCARRSFRDQAVCFRQSRTRKDIEDRIELLRAEGLDPVANAIEAAGPVKGVVGRHITYAVPGESWHQWGLALDGVPVYSGKLQWNRDSELWQVYGSLAEEAGFRWLGADGGMDYPHIQIMWARGKVPLDLLKDAVNRLACGSVSMRFAFNAALRAARCGRD